MYNKDIELVDKRLESLESKSDQKHNLIDEKSGRLKETGWLKRDKNLFVNSEDLKSNDKLNWLQQKVRVRH